MTVTLNKERPVGPNAVSLTWTSDDPNAVFDVYVNGALRLKGTRQRSLTLAARPDEAVVVDVFDDPNDVPDYARSTVGRLAFDAVVGTDYRIERQVGAEWELERLIGFDDTHQQINTEPITEDGESLRVTAINTDGQEGAPVVVAADIVRHPDPPVVDVAFSDATKKLTVSAVT